MGKVMLFQLPAADTDKLADFYSQTFGWTKSGLMGIPGIVALHSGSYDKAGLNGVIMDKKLLDYTVNIIEVDNIDETLLKLQDKGGKVTTPRHDIPAMGAFAWCLDNDGNQIVLMQRDAAYLQTMTALMPGGTPEVGIVNRPCHFELPASNPVQLADFYTEVFGWRVQKWESEIPYYFLISDEFPAAGIDGAIQQREEGLYPLNVIAVLDLDAKLAEVSANGGSIKSPKTRVPNVGMLAYCLDPDGNQFGLMQFDKLDW